MTFNENLQSPLATSLSFEGSSSLRLIAFAFRGLALGKDTFAGKPFRLYSTADMVRGRGGTAGLPFTVTCELGCTSSELESSCPANKLPTKLIV